MDHPPETSKVMLRKKLRLARPTLAARESNDGLAIQLQNLADQLTAQRIAAYLPFGDEPDISGFLEWAQEVGKELLLPVSNADGSLSWVIFDGSRKPGIFGFDEAVGSPGQLETADLVILPALAADSAGGRLGKGKGFYDRALAELRSPQQMLVAVVFDEELLPKVPTQAHDVLVDFVVTPTRTIRTSSA